MLVESSLDVIEPIVVIVLLLLVVIIVVVVVVVHERNEIVLSANTVHVTVSSPTASSQFMVNVITTLKPEISNNTRRANPLVSPWSPFDVCICLD